MQFFEFGEFLDWGGGGLKISLTPLSVWGLPALGDFPSNGEMCFFLSWF